MTFRSDDNQTAATRFTRLAYNPAKHQVSLAWEKANPDGWDAHSAKCHRMPSPEFRAALQDLAADLIGILELGAALLPEDIQVRAVSVTYGKDDQVGCVLTASRAVEASNAPWMIHTPHIPDVADLLYVEDTLLEKLDHLARQARRYLHGHGQQIDMLAPNDTDDDHDLPADLITDPAGAELVGA
jgi:hypothetical protein